MLRPDSIRLPVALVLLGAGPIVHAQTSFPEAEPNGTKAQATIVACMTSGDFITGTTTGTSTAAGDASLSSADTFRVRTCPMPPGVYRHELVITTSGTAGHTGTIRGLSQSGGAINFASDVEIQASSAATTPPRKCQWYGFGKAEEIYFRVTGTASTTSAYTATLTTTPVSLAQFNAWAAGAITITTCGYTATDTDLWVYDADFRPVQGFGNDDIQGGAGACPGNGLSSRLGRTFSTGTYYLAISDYNFANDQPAAVDDNFPSGSVLDFANGAANSSTSAPLSLNLGVTDSLGAAGYGISKNSAYEIRWIRFEVLPPGGGYAFCSPGAAGVQPYACGNPNGPGRGCGNTGGPGAGFSSSGSASLISDSVDPGSVVLTGTGMLSGSTCIFLQGDANFDAGITFGAGIRCITGNLRRLYVKSLVGAGGLKSAPEAGDPSISNRSAAIGDVIPPATMRAYQTYYRDPGLVNPGPPCPSSASFNVTPGVKILCGP